MWGLVFAIAISPTPHIGILHVSTSHCLSTACGCLWFKLSHPVDLGDNPYPKSMIDYHDITGHQWCHDNPLLIWPPVEWCDVVAKHPNQCTAHPNDNECALWLVTHWQLTHSAPGHYLNQCWIIVPTYVPVKFESKFNNIERRKSILICRLQNVCHFVLDSMCPGDGQKVHDSAVNRWYRKKQCKFSKIRVY